MKWVLTRMSVGAKLVYIKQFQIFGYVNKRLTRYVCLTHPNCLCFELKSPRKITWFESASIILNSLELGFQFGQ